MPVQVRTTSRGGIEIKITSTTPPGLDERRTKPRYEQLGRKEALVLIRQLAVALERVGLGVEGRREP